VDTNKTDENKTKQKMKQKTKQENNHQHTKTHSNNYSPAIDSSTQPFRPPTITYSHKIEKTRLQSKQN
jgi:hypothetical protein